MSLETITFPYKAPKFIFSRILETQHFKQTDFSVRCYLIINSRSFNLLITFSTNFKVFFNAYINFSTFRYEIVVILSETAFVFDKNFRKKIINQINR